MVKWQQLFAKDNIMRTVYFTLIATTTFLRVFVMDTEGSLFVRVGAGVFLGFCTAVPAWLLEYFLKEHRIIKPVHRDLLHLRQQLRVAEGEVGYSRKFAQNLAQEEEYYEMRSAHLKAIYTNEFQRVRGIFEKKGGEVNPV